MYIYVAMFPVQIFYGVNFLLLFWSICLFTKKKLEKFNFLNWIPEL